ncbi:M50 family metallopeptidase [Natronoglycomyces albus]|uniref:Site-2 protease family protein n=1 Tax=Natronoglycomyces albus TaxID=2811108 RepID=A0A895XNN2_9ACTN|nr:site-2 protease family protein [Natronoglycomyces albus]
MAYTIGIILFALAILISVSLHEAGHMLTAKAFKMKVTRYFVGFGPTLWSFHRGETEYGLKGIPLGGFVKITGMTPLDEEEESLSEKDKKRVFWRKPLWQRTTVLAAGSITHFILAFVILWVLVSFIGIANPALADQIEESQETATVAVAPCIPPEDATGTYECTAEDEPSPAAAAGLRDGDEITGIAGATVTDWDSLLETVSGLQPDEEVEITIRRDTGITTLDITPYSASVPMEDGSTTEVTRIGVSVYVDRSLDPVVTYGPISGVGQSFVVTGNLFTATFEALITLPTKIPDLWNSVFGAERPDDTPVSVVGASRLGGEMVQFDQWAMFFMLVVVLNYFVGIFNLLPLLPLDGGHIAIAWYERARSWLAARRGKPDPGRVDYLKLMPLTYAVLVVLGGFMLLTITADIVNPIRLFN